MNIQEYQKLAARTLPDLGDLERNIAHMQIGIVTEIGEALDIIKKNFAYGKPIDRVHLGEELADATWYLVGMSTLLNKTIDNDFATGYGVDPNNSDLGALMHIIHLFSQNEYKYSAESIAFALKFVADTHGIDYFKALENNINKLKVRYPDKFDAEKALNRDLDSERKELEK